MSFDRPFITAELKRRHALLRLHLQNIRVESSSTQPDMKRIGEWATKALDLFEGRGEEFDDEPEAA